MMIMDRGSGSHMFLTGNSLDLLGHWLRLPIRATIQTLSRSVGFFAKILRLSCLVFVEKPERIHPPPVHLEDTYHGSNLMGRTMCAQRAPCQTASFTSKQLIQAGGEAIIVRFLQVALSADSSSLSAGCQSWHFLFRIGY